MKDKLPSHEREFSADRLLSPLDGEELSDIDLTWITEAEFRSI